MTIEELTAALEKAQASITKLETKNSELIDREKKAKQAAEDAETAREEAANEAATKAGDVEAIKASLEKKYSAELKKRDDQIAQLSGDVSTYKIDSVISAEMAKAGVLPDAADWVTRALKTGAKIENGEAMVDGVPLADHIATFFASPGAKLVIAAPQNSGGGATGSNASATAHGFTKENIRTPQKEAEWLSLEKTNPTLFKQVAADTGRNEVL